MYRLVLDMSPHVMGISCDECFADLTALPNPEEAVAALRSAVRAQTGCSCSVGIGSSRLLARIATRRAKPDGQFRLGVSEGRAMLRDERVSSLPGCGPKVCASLEKLGITTCDELRLFGDAKPQQLRQAVGRRACHAPRRRQRACPSKGPRLACACCGSPLTAAAAPSAPKVGAKSAETLRAFVVGVDTRPWDPRPPRKSIGAQASWGVRFDTAAEANTFTSKLATEGEPPLRDALVLTPSPPHAAAPSPPHRPRQRRRLRRHRDAT